MGSLTYNTSKLWYLAPRETRLLDWLECMAPQSHAIITGISMHLPDSAKRQFD